MLDKQKMFVLCYLQDFNATKAAIRAGYSEKTASQIAVRLLGEEHIKAEIQRQLAEVEVTTHRVLGELTKVAYADIGDYVKVHRGGEVEAKPFEKLVPGATRAIKKVKEKRKIMEGKGDDATIIVDNQYEFEMHDKLKALELLGKHLGMFKDGVQLSSQSDSKPIEIVFKRPDAG